MQGARAVATAIVRSARPLWIRLSCHATKFPPQKRTARARDQAYRASNRAFPDSERPAIACLHACRSDGPMPIGLRQETEERGLPALTRKGVKIGPVRLVLSWRCTRVAGVDAASRERLEALVHRTVTVIARTSDVIG